jgi:tellurite resistance protein TerC
MGSMPVPLIGANGAAGLSILSGGLLASFCLAVLVLLALDLGVFQKTPRAPTMREAAAWCLVWAALACVFGLALGRTHGGNASAEFFTAYFVEQALSVDNLFVMLLVFGQLAIPEAHRRRVLVCGIVGVVVLRGLMLGVGAAAVAKLHFLGWILGAVLVVTAVKLLREIVKPAGESSASSASSDAEGETPRAAGVAVRLLSRVMPVTKELHGGRFTVVLNGVRHATPLLVALVAIEAADAVFALDSIPAVLGVSTNPLVILTSNLFAVLGLRSMFFLLSRLLERLTYLKHGLAAVLLVVGLKMVVASVWTAPTWLALGLVLSILVCTVTASLLVKQPRSRSTEDARIP